MDVKLRSFRIDALLKIQKGQTKYVRSYYRLNPGIYPVFSASVFETSVAGWIDTYDFDGNYITWTTNGYAGRAIKRSGRFSVTRDVGVLLPRPEHSEHLDLDFLVVVLTEALSSAATGRYKDSGAADYTKIATKSAAGVTINVPVDSRGTPCLAAQRYLAGRFMAAKRARSELQSISQRLKEMRLIGPSLDPDRLKEFPVKILFEPPVRGSGKLTQNYIRSHSGPYPVYSGSSFRDEVAGFIDTYRFEGPCLTWAADGYAGYVFVRQEKFSANSHCGILRPNAEYRDKLHLPYVALVLEPILLEIAVGRHTDTGRHEYTRVTTEMVHEVRIPLPLDADGSPDVKHQVELADRLLLLLETRNRMLSAIETLAESPLEVNEFQIPV